MISSHSVLGIACMSITRQGTTGATEIDSNVLSRPNANTTALPTELQALQALAARLRQLATAATDLRGTLNRNASSTPSASSHNACDALATALPSCDAAVATLVKQLMRCDYDTSLQQISLAAALTYDHFASAAASFFDLMAAMMTGSQQQANPTLVARDVDTLLARVSRACADVTISGGILLDGGLGNATQPLTFRLTAPSLSLLDTDNDVTETTPPRYEVQAPSDARGQPPPFEALPDSTESMVEDGDDKRGRAESDVPAYASPAPAYHSAEGIASKGNKCVPSTPPPPPHRNRSLLSSLAEPLRSVANVLRPKPEPLVVALCEAASRGEVAQMRSLVAQGGINVNGRNEQGRTALICAVLADQPAAVRFLLGSEARADPCVCDSIGLSFGNSTNHSKPPLYRAVERLNMPMTELLLADEAAGGASLAGQKDSYGQSYFSLCVLGDTPAKPWLELLLRHGAAATHKDLTGRPLVMVALDKRQNKHDVEDVVSLLLRYGASPSSTDDDGTALVHRCVDQGRGKLALRLVLMGADANGRDVSGSPVLLAALKRGDRALVAALLEHGADPNAKDIYGSPMIAALMKMPLIPADRDAMAKLLLARGARRVE
ncbi:ankyrin repeat-containing domain protein [Microdochium trichocladiopsis]|uniref:Ankyrin repeat-containing domain protein n=1 Tax=Microdochium trichocladiopsis TaxID=1682393 RepID=A0A9P8YJV2_9PEZI|nr:ankyrin repeat-containing domain protein [Microdochium trichocladiopsis]KAH7041615.1 ankyrin repeat-containing domain protein [Microdochium trichocladiopsis]